MSSAIWREVRLLQSSRYEKAPAQQQARSVQERQMLAQGFSPGKGV